MRDGHCFYSFKVGPNNKFIHIHIHIYIHIHIHTFLRGLTQHLLGREGSSNSLEFPNLLLSDRIISILFLLLLLL